MLKTLALAGATAALVVGTIAVAQTTQNTDPNYNNNGSAAAAPANGQTTTTTTTTDQSANNTANTNMAGERG